MRANFAPGDGEAGPAGEAFVHAISGPSAVAARRLRRTDELRMTVPRVRANFSNAGLGQFAAYRTFNPFADDLRASGLEALRRYIGQN